MPRIRGPPLSSEVPGASTNYNYASYATGTPPAGINDGDYALVNQVPANYAWFAGATDHTGNTNGYMAIFNAAPTPGIFYQQTISGLCPGTTYEFAAWIANLDDLAILPGAVLPNITFQILDPSTLNVLGSYNSGDIPQFNSMTWNQYSFLFTEPSGINSVILVLSNNNVGGLSQLGNDLAMDDITFRPCGPTTTASISNTTICSGNNVGLIGNVSSGLANPAYQRQISSDSGVTFTNINGATSLNYTESGLLPGFYQFQLLSAEAGNISAASCRFISDTVTLTVDSLNFDFYYMQDVCNPLIVQFNSAGNDSLNPFFSFGDGITSNGKTIVSHTYSSPGNYTVKYSAQNVNGCIDTITKIIAVTTTQSNIIITPDTTICQHKAITNQPHS